MSRKYSAIVLPVWTLASLEAIGMLQVFATRVVRFIRGCWVRGSRRVGNVSNFSHLVSSLAATDIDDNLSVGKFCKGLLHYCIVADHGSPSGDEILETGNRDIVDLGSGRDVSDV